MKTSFPTTLAFLAFLSLVTPVDAATRTAVDRSIAPNTRGAGVSGPHADALQFAMNGGGMGGAQSMMGGMMGGSDSSRGDSEGARGSGRRGSGHDDSGGHTGGDGNGSGDRMGGDVGRDDGARQDETRPKG